MKFDLYILRVKGKKLNRPVLLKQASIAIDKNHAYAFDSEGERQITNPLHVVEIEIVKDGMFIRGLEQSSDNQTAWYQEWWLRQGDLLKEIRNDRNQEATICAAEYLGVELSSETTSLGDSERGDI